MRAIIIDGKSMNSYQIKQVGKEARDAANQLPANT
jgi:hypothetical protein